jgi:site-specific recombinase XerC
VASIKKRSDGVWRARYKDAEGKEHALHARTKAEVTRRLNTELAKLEGGTWTDPKAGRVTFSAYVADWKATKAGVSARTRINVDGRIDNHATPFFGKMRLGSVRPVHVRSFVADLVGRGLAPATVEAITLTTGQVFGQAVRDGIIARSPFDGVELPPERHHEEMCFLNADEVNVLAAAIEDERYRAGLYVAAYGGLRAGEVWALTPARVNVFARTIDVVESLCDVRGNLVIGPTKTGKRRTITVPRFLAEMVGDHMGRFSSPEYVFTAKEGGPVRHRNFMRRHFKPAVERVPKLPPGLRFHDLRHTCAALLIANGRHLEEVKDYLGHSSIRVTSDRYGHLFPKARAELADALDKTFSGAVPANFADFSRTPAGLMALPGAAAAV